MNTINTPATVRELSAPAGFEEQAAPVDGVEMGGDLRVGPTFDIVTTSWSAEEGTLVYVGDSEGMSVEAAQRLLTDLQRTLGSVAGL